MDNMEIPELSKEAKRLGLRSYSRLRKQELIEKIQRDWLLKSERLSTFLMKKFRCTSINQFSNQKWYVRVPEIQITDTEKEKREKESGEIEEMLGLRGGARDHSPAGGRLPKIKISNPEEAERERKIKEIKEIKRNRPRFQMVETASALGVTRRQFTITSKEKGFGPRDFMQRAKPLVLRLMRENRQKTINLILNCEMIRQNLINGNTEKIMAHSHTRTTVYSHLPQLRQKNVNWSERIGEAEDIKLI